MCRRKLTRRKPPSGTTMDMEPAPFDIEEARRRSSEAFAATCSSHNEGGGSGVCPDTPSTRARWADRELLYLQRGRI